MERLTISNEIVYCTTIHIIVSKINKKFQLINYMHNDYNLLNNILCFLFLNIHFIHFIYVWI